MADKHHSDTREEIESIVYSPGLQDTGDLEEGTHTIVPTSRPAIGSAQYSAALTLPKPDDARLVLKRIGIRLSVNIAGLGTATHVYCSVRVDVDDTDHELFNEDWTSTGAKLAGTSKNTGTLLDLLSDGSAHTFYFLFWADAASQATIDVVQLWEGCGRAGVAAIGECLKLSHVGFVQMAFLMNRLGTANAYFTVELSGSWDKNGIWRKAGSQVFSSSAAPLLVLCNDYLQFLVEPGNTTDLAYVQSIRLVLRSEA